MHSNGGAGVAAVVAAIRGLPEPGAGLGSDSAMEVAALMAAADLLHDALLARVAIVDADGSYAATGAVSMASWLRRATRCSDATASRLVRTARRLHTDTDRPLELTAAALRAGDLCADQAQAVVQVTAQAPVEIVAPLEEALVVHARHLGATELAKVAHGLVRQLREQDQQGTAATSELERGGCYLTISNSIFGRVAIDGVLSPEVGALLQAVLDPLAAPVRTELPDGSSLSDPRSAGERQHDALGEALARLADNGLVPEQNGLRPHLHVLVDLDKLLAGNAIGRTPDGQPIDSSTVERTSCDARVSWTAFRSPDIRASTAPAFASTIDPETIRAALSLISPALGGAGLDVLAAGRTIRTASHAQRRALNARDRGCAIPGCHAPPRRCQAHHLTPWAHGGNTDLDGMALICAPHHRMLRDRNWTLRRTPDGRFSLQVPPDPLAAAA